MRQAHTARSARDERDQRGARLVAQATGRATPARDERRPAGRGRPVAKAAGRARSQRFRATSASGGSARRVRAAVPRDECGQRFCATSASSGSARRVRAAVQRDKCEQRFRATSASRSGSVIRGGARGASARGESQNFGWRPVRAARRSSRTAECGRPPCAEVAFSGIKGGGAFWILQSRRSEHPYGGNCTERHRTRTTAGGAAYAVPCESTRT